MSTSPRRLRRLIAGTAGAATIASMVTLGGPSFASVSAPWFPPSVAVDSSAYTLQFAGANREGTAATIALDSAVAKSPTAGYPFDTADKSGTAAANTLYGPSVCPDVIVLVADDTPADALSAAGLRDGLSTGGVKTTNASNTLVTFPTKHPELLLTKSVRTGGTDLDATTAAAISRIKDKCSGTLNGVVLGGTGAVSDTAFNSFKALVADAARISGTDRQDTARVVAQAEVAAGRTLPAVHYFAAASAPSAATAGGASLAKSVFLAEDQTGADALSVGALASLLGVPILLTDTHTLNSETSNALTALHPTNVIALGGVGAIDPAVLTAAVAAAGAGASSTRVAGATRYGTSVAIAEQLFNLYPDYVSALGATGYSDQLFGFARDEGSAAGGNHVGWPDALASAYYLAAAGAPTASATVSAPVRHTPAVEKSSTVTGDTTFATVTCGGGNKCYPNVPLLLTANASLSSEVDTYLKAMYPASGSYKTGDNSPAGSNNGGFGFVFGGSGAVSPADSAAIGSDLSGGTYGASNNDDLTPTLTAGQTFFTTNDLTPFTSSAPAPPGATTTQAFNGGSNPTGNPQVCSFVGAAAGVLNFATLDEKSAIVQQQVKYFDGKAASGPYAAGKSLGSCVSASTENGYTASAHTVTAYGASLSGHESSPVAINFSPADILSGAPGPTNSTTNTESGNIYTAIGTGNSEQATDHFLLSSFGYTYRGTTGTGSARLDVNLTRTKGANSTDFITWTGTLAVYPQAGQAGTAVFTAAVTGGIADATPATAGAQSAPVNLVGVYSAPGLGALSLTLNPPSPVPMSTSTVSNLKISGNA